MSPLHGMICIASPTSKDTDERTARCPLPVRAVQDDERFVVRYEKRTSYLIGRVYHRKTKTVKKFLNKSDRYCRLAVKGEDICWWAARPSGGLSSIGRSRSRLLS